MKPINEKTLLTERRQDKHADQFRRMTNRVRSVHQSEDGGFYVKLHGQWWAVQKWAGWGWGRAYLLYPRFEVGDLVRCWGDGDTVYRISTMTSNAAFLVATEENGLDGGWKSLEGLRPL